MIEVGKINRLKIARDTGFGFFLEELDAPSDSNSGDEALLLYKNAPIDAACGDTVDAFIYLDRENRMVASTKEAKIELGKIAKLKVTNVTDFGAFVDWGMDKELFVPKAEQKDILFVGEETLFTLQFDNQSDRLYASSKIERYLDLVGEELEDTQEDGEREPKLMDKVDIIVYQNADFGWAVAVNQKYRGMIYNNEIYKAVDIGYKTQAWVKKVRDDGKLDISLHPVGYRNSTDPNANAIMDLLNEHDGYLEITDKSSPETISELFGFSKKAFKRAIGSLYRDRVITLEKDGIRAN